MRWIVLLCLLAGPVWAEPAFAPVKTSSTPHVEFDQSGRGQVIGATQPEQLQPPALRVQHAEPLVRAVRAIPWWMRVREGCYYDPYRFYRCQQPSPYPPGWDCP
ncbi:MAG: hypothetical protein KC910_12300 [Candidatus Eremiobacteraeota bacterium]|nr:hypothetical protein [Candidatus Eremiobacteraeota bacterium]